MKLCPVCSTEYGDDVKFCKNDGSALRALAPSADLVGQVVAERYHVLKKLGEGGMGQVYLAEHVKMGRRSAIKVMNPALVHDPEAIARFNREASNASRITHPNVCAIYDFGETPEGLIYLAMEFVEGEPLTDLLEGGGALPLERAVDVFLQTADALQAAHDLGIVHRDLKPDNIMLTRGRSGADVVKVVDFGIAKAVGGDDSQKVTKTGLVIGTPEFMSPEQLAGDKLDGRSDLYSLALVFFRMLTGTLPFDADTVQETMVQRLTDEPRTLAAARPEFAFPPGLQACFDTALARTPAERYQTIAKFANDVAQVVGLRGAPAVPRARPDADAQTQLLAGADTRLLGRRSTPPTRPPAAAAAAPVRKRRLAPIALGVVALVGAGGAGVALLGGNNEATGEQTSGDTTRTAAASDTARQAGRPPSESGRPRERASSVLLDAAAADALVERLIEASPAVIVDSATIVYDATNLPARTRGFAACLRAQAHGVLDNGADALRWARRGLALDTTLSSCRDIVRRFGGGA